MKNKKEKKKEKKEEGKTEMDDCVDCWRGTNRWKSERRKQKKKKKKKKRRVNDIVGKTKYRDNLNKKRKKDWCNK